ncbi:MAG: RluA family pseudouridine synthase [Eubacteriaceae bacterium]|nr:RluA family pseudouridine synthase [Eubacteriaceae bacterium]
MEKIILTVSREEAGMRSDRFLADHAGGFSRQSLKESFDSGMVTLAGRPVKPSLKLREGDVIEAVLPDTAVLDAVPQDIPLDIVYEDADIAVVDKPAGMVVHPANGNFDGTMVNALMYHLDSLSAINGVIRPGIVHRIDKDTSGLLVVAKNDRAHEALAEQFRVHSITRRYTALLNGILSEKRGTIDAPIGRDPANRLAFTVTARNSKRAVTHFETAGLYEGFTHVYVTLETGRTHQIRVHMKYIGHPVIGDPLYSGGTELDRMFDGQLLHACTLGFIHPSTGEYVEFESPIPERFNILLKGRQNNGR